MPILDSSFLIAYRNEQDSHHKAALAAMQRAMAGAWGAMLLPEYVFLEVVTVLLARRGLDSAVSAGLALLNAREIEFVPCWTHFSAAFEIFRNQRPPRMSLADAAIVAIARDRGMTEIATFDKDFADVEDLAVVP